MIVTEAETEELDLTGITLTVGGIFSEVQRHETEDARPQGNDLRAGGLSVHGRCGDDGH